MIDIALPVAVFYIIYEPLSVAKIRNYVVLFIFDYNIMEFYGFSFFLTSKEN